MVDNVENTPRKRGRPPKAAKVEAPVEVITQEAPVEYNDRPPMRPALRDEDPRVAAARRAAEIKGNIGDLDQGTDDFIAPPAPEGWTYEWKRRTVMGQEDPGYQIHLARMGWEPVPTERHPEMMPTGGSYANIERKGMVLMMRPSVITDEVRALERQRAIGQVSAKEQQLNQAPDGQFERTNKDSSMAKIKKAYEPIQVPND